MSSLLIIGAGNMGGAFYRGLREAMSYEMLAVSDTNTDKLKELGAERASTDPHELLPECDAVLLAVKPQGFEECVNGIKQATLRQAPSFASGLRTARQDDNKDEAKDDASLKNKLILSIMAGITIDHLKQKTGSDRIIRAMPNLAATVGESLTGWVASDACTDDDRKMAQSIFNAVGKSIELSDEKQIDAITPLSGSGPAYFFLLIEILQKKAEAFGFSSNDAQLIAEQTLIGSAKLLAKNEKTAEEWRVGVTSKGGVTEAALQSLNDAGLEKIFSDAIEKAKKRNEELGK